MTEQGTGAAAGAGAGTVGKALDVLEQVAEFARPVRFAELLAHSDHPKATLYRLVQTLVATGMLHHDPQSQTYGLGLRLVRLAHGAWRQTSLAPLARPHLDRLAEETGMTVHLAQLDNGQVLYLDKRNARQPVGMYSEAGKVAPAYCTGVGKAMLAWLAPEPLAIAVTQQSFHRYTAQTIVTGQALRQALAEIRQAGHALDREEHEAGIVCVAIPLLTGDGAVLGGLSLTGAASQMSPEGLSKRVPRLSAAAAAILADLADWGFPDATGRRGGSDDEGRCPSLARAPIPPRDISGKKKPGRF